VVMNGDTVASSSFRGHRFPRRARRCPRELFVETGAHQDLTLTPRARGWGRAGAQSPLSGENSAGPGGSSGGHWGLVPSLGKQALENKIEAYCFPGRHLAHLFERSPEDVQRDLHGRQGAPSWTRASGRQDERDDHRGLIEVLRSAAQEYLFDSFPINIALLRGTTRR